MSSPHRQQSACWVLRVSHLVAVGDLDRPSLVLPRKLLAELLGGEAPIGSDRMSRRNARATLPGI